MGLVCGARGRGEVGLHDPGNQQFVGGAGVWPRLTRAEGLAGETSYM